MTPELEAALAQREALQQQIGALMAKPQPLNATDQAYLKVYRRQLQQVNAQIVILETPPEIPPEIPF